jgi:hypothetical protein
MMQTAVLAALLLFALNAAADEKNDVFKCETDGKVSYSKLPCPAGSSTELEVVPPAPSAPVDPHIKAEADRLAKLRHQHEAQDAQLQERIERADRAQRQRCDQLRLRAKWSKEALARASSARRAQLERQSRQAARQLATACPA